MRRWLFSIVLFSLCSSLSAAPDQDLPPKIAKRTEEVTNRLMGLENCDLLFQVYHPSNAKLSQLGFCLYSNTVTQGIYKATSCVGVLVEPDSGVRNPFYGGKGHWGIEGNCDKTKVREKLADPKLEETVNPVTSIRMKREEGFRIKMLRDTFSVWTMFDQQTTPKAPTKLTP
jgi:hypothetical protein